MCIVSFPRNSPEPRQNAKENSSDHDMERSGLGEKLEGWDFSNYRKLTRNATLVQNGSHHNGMLIRRGMQKGDINLNFWKEIGFHIVCN